MTKLLGIGLDYLMLQNNKIRGDVRQRQIEYASKLDSYNLVIYSPKDSKLSSERLANNLWVHPTNSESKNFFILDALKIASMICKKNNISTITVEDPFTTGIVGYLLKNKLKIPLNVQVHIDFCNNYFWIKQRKINRLFNLLGKFILKKADTIRVGTNYEKIKLCKILKINKEKIKVIPVNSDLNKFKNIDGGSIRKRYFNGRFDKILLFSGRLVPQKDIQTLLRSFHIIKNTKQKTLLLLIGTGPQEEALKRLCINLDVQDNVIFTGSIDHNTISEYLAACDVYTISSIFEGTCIAMAEAMASRKPVVATKFAGAMDLIEDGETGFKVNQGDYKAFAEKVLYLLNNPDIAKRIGENATRKVEEVFSNNQNIDKVIKMWEETAKC